MLSCKLSFVYPVRSGTPKDCDSIILNLRNIQNKLFVDANVQFEICPVSGHFMHGRVERKIKQIKESIEKTLYNYRLSLLQWGNTCIRN